MFSRQFETLGIRELIPDAAAPEVSSGTTAPDISLGTGRDERVHGCRRRWDVAGALAAQVTIMNRVDGVYEREVAIRMDIVANNNLIVYTDGTTLIPVPNNNGSTMLGENQSQPSDAVIGSANYDIGHVFSTGGGGIATVGGTCGLARRAA